MSIIVGVESTVEPYISVIAADTLGTSFILEFLPYYIKEIDKDKQPKERVVKQIKEGIPTSISHKIDINESKRIVLARVGNKYDNISEHIRGFLLEGPDYLKKESSNFHLATVHGCVVGINSLAAILSGCFIKTDDIGRVTGIMPSKEFVSEFMQAYIKDFSLEEKLLSGHIPELSGIIGFKNRLQPRYDYGIGADDPSFQKPFWYSDSAYLLSTIVNAETKPLVYNKRPMVFPVRPWGACRRVKPFSALGFGAPYAYKYLHKELGIAPEKEGYVNPRIDSDNAIRLATGAVEESNRECPYSKGLDYVILTNEGIEPHISTEEKSEPIKLSPEEIKLEIEKLKSHIDRLEIVRALLEENKI